MNQTARTGDGTSLSDRVERIQSREAFVAFVGDLLANLREKPDEWENHDLPSFLEGLAAWTEDAEGYFQNRGEALPTQPTWKTLGQMLLAAKVYE